MTKYTEVVVKYEILTNGVPDLGMIFAARVLTDF